MIKEEEIAKERFLKKMENMKRDYQTAMQKYMKALIQEHKNEMLILKDGLTWYKEKIDDHDNRITRLESSAL